MGAQSVVAMAIVVVVRRSTVLAGNNHAITAALLGRWANIHDADVRLIPVRPPENAMLGTAEGAMIAATDIVPATTSSSMVGSLANMALSFIVLGALAEALVVWQGAQALVWRPDGWPSV